MTLCCGHFHHDGLADNILEFDGECVECCGAHGDVEVSGDDRSGQCTDDGQ
jgi:hypothetical protein